MVKSNYDKVEERFFAYRHISLKALDGYWGDEVFKLNTDGLGARKFAEYMIGQIFA